MQRATSEQAKQQRRQALLDAALNEFSERGFAATRMQTIAERAGLSKGTLYLYFSSKEALFAALIETVSLPKIKQIQHLAQQQTSIKGLFYIQTQLAGQLLKDNKVTRLIKLVIGESSRFPELANEYHNALLEPLHTNLASQLQNFMQQGQIQQQDSHLLARLILAPIAYSLIWQATFGHAKSAGFDYQALLKLQQQTYLQGLLCPKEKPCNNA